MRAFFCIELDEAMQVELERIIGRLRRQVAARVSWVSRENLHVTLKFLGEIDPVIVPQLQSAAREAVREIAAFDWELNRLGAFPHLQRPRVLWVGCRAEPQPLQALHAALDAQLQRLGYPPDREAFTAHVTLGRIKEGPHRSMEIAQALEGFAPFAYPVRTKSITMMESQLTPSGANYRSCFRLAFPGACDHAL